MAEALAWLIIGNILFTFTWLVVDKPAETVYYSEFYKVYGVVIMLVFLVLAVAILV